MTEFDHEAFLREAGFGGPFRPRSRDDAELVDERVIPPIPRDTTPEPPADPRRPLAGTPVPPELLGRLA